MAETHLGRRIGARIASWRRRKGITQEALGAALDPPVDSQTVSRWERATREPSFARIEQIAKALGERADALLSGVSSESAAVSQDRQRLLERLEGLTDGQVAGVRKVVDAHLDAARAWSKVE